RGWRLSEGMLSELADDLCELSRDALGAVMDGRDAQARASLHALEERQAEGRVVARLIGTARAAMESGAAEAAVGALAGMDAERGAMGVDGATLARLSWWRAEEAWALKRDDAGVAAHVRWHIDALARDALYGIRFGAGVDGAE
ncbi:MAG: hypothetical protein VYC34_02735, partial [Planctomycetota bacterium]|nr:hypothetical protein [Planctomycetota bacterium]